MAINHRTILLVEDNQDDEELTMRALRRNHISNQVSIVRDGQEAVDWLEATGPYAARDPADVPALILLDLKLPKIDGLEVLRRLRANPRTALVPVVILTSSKEERDRASGYQSGANSYVQKPVDFTAFVDAVRQLGLYWLMLNEPPPAASEVSSPS
jgi:two-component system response regulator